MFPCGNLLCTTCPYANFINVFTSLTFSLSYPIFYYLTCKSSGVIYIIECSNCGKRYVGQTGQTLHHRIAQHLANIKSHNQASVLCNHFRNECGLHNFSFFAISRHDNEKTRLAKEAAWIDALNTMHPHGLNTVTRSEPQPVNLILP